jgi:F-type H+-transporting ATPase subunit a
MLPQQAARTGAAIHSEKKLPDTDVTAAAHPLALATSHTASIAGLEFNLDTMAATVAAGLIVIAAGLYARRGLSADRPTKVQLAWETIVLVIERRLSRAGAARHVISLAVALFVFILAAGLFEIIPSGHPHKALPVPTGDLNLTAALAAFTILVVHASGIRARGLRGYLRHYLKPTPWLLPLRLLEEFAKPITLALRLFGNVFAGTVMVLLIFELIPSALAPLPLLAWKLFAVFVAGMQAFIFALLTVLYFETALGPGDDHDPESGASTGAVIVTGGRQP